MKWKWGRMKGEGRKVPPKWSHEGRISSLLHLLREGDVSGFLALSYKLGIVLYVY